ncbi:YdcF family protein [Paucilactobacillus wasatchensis]|uniref:DUF218 domain-containing protein n=1 Tax=Paucilactobacillus wasatchensis TaxID=1335616 RepID=A0A0D1A442_9LACO|nr:YdcF family protein [Paucilactobacillus wasatchensis]KIS02630.1 hypothetical protein WDC_1799 [Paucilactobacillus wasatchensis]
MLIILISLFTLGALVLFTIRHRPFLQLTGYLSVVLLYLLANIGLIIVWPVAILILTLATAWLLSWLVLAWRQLVRYTPQIVARLSLKFKIILALTAALLLASITVNGLVAVTNLQLPVLISWLAAVPIYFILSLIAYYLNSWLLATRNQNTASTPILLVLGAGLIDGSHHPGHELQRRLNKAIELNQAHTKTIVVAGGQGLDEQQSEAAAMQDYLLNHGISPSQIILETQSRNTWQNLVNSQQIILHHFQQQQVTVLSNQYHLLRVCLYAQKLNFQVLALGVNNQSKVFKSSSIREWIGIVLLHPLRHCLYAIICASITTFLV